MNACPDCGFDIPEDAPLGLCPACLIGSADEDAFETPADSDERMIGDYRIIRQVGEGGFAVVYEAEQIEPVRRRVALKVLKPGASSPQVLARFDAERQALALMDHPNIASIYDAGETPDGNPYFAMEFVDGGAITEFSARRGLPLEKRLEILRRICEAVQHAHLKGVLHRDIKPSNTLVSEVDGRPLPKVIDFGIARALDVSLTKQVLFTEFHQIVGTPSYMSPEQAALDNSPLDGRSDIYSLGMLIYETLTGVQPFSDGQEENNSIPELLRRVCEEEPPPLSHYVPELRGDIQWVVSKAIAKKPEDRYDSAGSLARELERVLENRPVQAAAPSNWYRFRKFVRRHRVPVTAGALAVLALIAGISVATIQYLHATRLSGDLQIREVELRHEFRNSDFKMGLQLAARRRPGDAIAHFCRALRTDPDHHASASCLLALLANQKFTKAVYPAIEYPDAVRNCRNPVVFNESQSIISLVDEPERIVKWAPETGAFESVSTGFDEPVRFLIPLGFASRFAVSAGKAVEIRSAENPGEMIFRFDFDAPVTCLVSSSGVLGSGREDGNVTLWDVKTGEVSKSRELSRAAITALGLSQEGGLVGYGTSEGEVGTWEVAPDRQVSNSDTHSGRITALALPESGSHLVTGDEKGVVYLWRGRNLVQVAGPIYHGDAVRVLRINSAYRRLMSGSDDGYARSWNMLDGSLVPPAQFHRSPVTFGLLTSSAREFISGGNGGTLRIWSAIDGSGEAFPGGAQTSAVAVNSNRRRLVTFSDRRRRVSLYEIDREPSWPRRLNPGDGIDHTETFGDICPEQLMDDPGRVPVQVTSNFSLFSGVGESDGHFMRTLQPIASWALRPDGRQVAALTDGGKFQIWDPRSGEELTPPLRLTEAEIVGVRFPDEDGQLEVLLSDGELARFEIPPPEPVLPPWFLEFAEQMGGKRLSEGGAIRNLDETSLQAVAGSIPELGSDPGQSDQVAWSYVHWLLSERAERTPGPSQDIVVGDYVELLLETGDPIFVREALRLDPGNQRGTDFLKKSGSLRPLRQ